MLVLALVTAAAPAPMTPEMLRRAATEAVAAGYDLRSVDVERLPFTEEVRGRLLGSEFARLDALARELRGGRETVYGGWPKLAYFYRVLAPSDSDADPATMQVHFSRLKAWVATAPASSAAHIALATMYRQLGWHARGPSLANKVTEAGWRDFNAYLDQAGEHLQLALNTDAADPQLYVELIYVAKDTSRFRDDAPRHLARGLELAPDYSPLFRAYGHGLLPQWGGATGELQGFAAETASRFKGAKADIEYARIAFLGIAKSPTDFARDYGFSWPRMKRGIEALLSSYPDSSELNHAFGWAACAYGDRPTASELFSRLLYGLDRDSQAVWGRTSKHFDRCAAWAKS
jgi:hypothetical protein